MHTAQASKAARLHADKALEEVDELVKKSQQLEVISTRLCHYVILSHTFVTLSTAAFMTYQVELDKAQEELTTTSQKLEEKEKALSGAELEVSALNRRVQVTQKQVEKLSI